MPADNLSAITRQLQSYYENVFDKQSNAADYFIEQVYWPEILAAELMMSIQSITSMQNH
jgi:hypothetical protein